MQLYCNYCDLQQDGVVCDTGTIACENCGITIMEDYLVNEVQFAKGSDGHMRMQGSFVNSWHSESASMERSINRGHEQISMLIMSLNMDHRDTIEVEDMAMKFYRRAAQRQFTRRYKIDYVAAACTYLACRAKEKPYLLIDFSEKLAVSVYVIGAVYLQLCLLLYLADDPIVQKPVDPSLFIHKFTQALVQRMENDTMPKEKRINTITNMALSIIASMKRDWMQTGRKPSGLCGAAIYVAALSEGIRYPKSEVINVVHICEATLTKRLIEFENTESGSLTIDEFTKRAEYFESQQYEACTNKSDRTEVLCSHKTEAVYAHGLCKECHDEFIKLSGGLDCDAANPPSFQRLESEQVSQNVADKINDQSPDQSYGEYIRGKTSRDTTGQENNIMMDVAEKSADPQFYNNNSVNYKDSEDLTNDDPECLSDIDDQEINCYLNNEQEKHFKTIIWEQMNKEYLEEQALKEAAKVGSYFDTAEITDEMPEEQKLAAAASAAVALARKKKRQQRAPNGSSAVPRTAAEAIAGVLKNKGNRKINVDVLQKLFDEDDAETASKKMRKDLEDGFISKESDANSEEEVDNVNNSYAEAGEDYQEDYETDPYNNDYHHDGNTDPYSNNDHYYDGNNDHYYDGNTDHYYDGNTDHYYDGNTDPYSNSSHYYDGNDETYNYGFDEEY